MRFDNIIMMKEKFETWRFWFWKASIKRIVVRKTLWSDWFESPTPSLDYPAQYPTHGLYKDVVLFALFTAWSFPFRRQLYFILWNRVYFPPSITITHQMRNSAFRIVLSVCNRQDTLCLVECAILKQAIS